MQHDLCVSHLIVSPSTGNGHTRTDKTRQEANRSRRQPEGSFFYSFCRNLRHLPEITAGVGATRLPLHAQLVPSDTGTHFTHHE